jgi:hypothetical protein
MLRLEGLEPDFGVENKDEHEHKQKGVYRVQLHNKTTTWKHLPKTAKMKVMSPSNSTCDIGCAKYPSLLRPYQGKNEPQLPNEISNTLPNQDSGKSRIAWQCNPPCPKSGVCKGNQSLALLRGLFFLPQRCGFVIKAEVGFLATMIGLIGLRSGNLFIILAIKPHPGRVWQCVQCDGVTAGVVVVILLLYSVL